MSQEHTIDRAGDQTITKKDVLVKDANNNTKPRESIGSRRKLSMEPAANTKTASPVTNRNTSNNKNSSHNIDKSKASTSASIEEENKENQDLQENPGKSATKHDKTNTTAKNASLMNKSKKNKKAKDVTESIQDMEISAEQLNTSLNVSHTIDDSDEAVAMETTHDKSKKVVHSPKPVVVAMKSPAQVAAKAVNSNKSRQSSHIADGNSKI